MGVIELRCRNCGSNLQVYPDMDVFACGHCGTQMAVERRGGTVSLKAVTEAIQRVQSGTDRTASELALARLAGELEQLKQALEATPRYRSEAFGMILFASIVGLGMGVLVSKATNETAGTCVGFGAAFAVLVYLGRPINQEEITSLTERIAHTETEIARHREFLGSALK